MIEKIVKYNLQYGTTTTVYKPFGKVVYTRREYKNGPNDGVRADGIGGARAARA